MLMNHVSELIVGGIVVLLLVLAFVRYDEVGRYAIGWGTGLVLCAIGLFVRSTSETLAMAILVPGAAICIATSVAGRRNKRRRAQS